MGRKRSSNPGLPPRMRRRAKGKKHFYYYDAGGKPRREIPLGSDYLVAIQKWAELEKVGQHSVQEQTTFREVAERYVAHVLPTKAARTQRDNLTELRWLYRFFDDPPAPLHTIRPVHVRQYMDWRTDNGKTARTRANRERALLSHIWNYARERGLTDAPNPTTGVHGFAEAGRQVYFEEEVYQAIYHQACKPIRDAMDLAYLTGQRPADVLAMTQVKIRKGALEIRQAKTGHPLRMRMTDEAGKPNELGLLVERLRQQATTGNVHNLQLIQNESGQPLSHQALIKRFRKARTRAAAAAEAAGKRELQQEIAGVQFRDLRAKAGTDKAASQDYSAAQRQLGHTSPAMTQRYIRHRKGDFTDPTR